MLKSMNGSSSYDNHLWRIIIRTAIIWLILIGAEIIHGVLRAITLVSMVGEFRSNQIGVFTGSLIIFAISYLSIHWIGAKTNDELLLVGMIWLILTVSFEVLFGRFVAGLSWKQLSSSYNLLEGGLMPMGLIFLFFSPMIAASLRKYGGKD
ncbi:hypothetical protein Pla110_22120 [Polystyrenella longa]|uniref:Uncharacterized protein n=1 Tax=Polystyrenella longa TaxID=2528007 RepID=A0A518CMN2_9PLAN|nr:hypothetical protein [Polystyrenella longa]QDU80482.1 hypothetical protein Pla110_22120 [Polystyrenella longa]